MIEQKRNKEKELMDTKNSVVVLGARRGRRGCGRINSDAKI